MAQQAYPEVNGFECSWADIEVTIDVLGGQEVKDLDLTAIKWDRSIAEGFRKRRGRKVKRTVGEEDQTASATLSRSSHVKLIRALMAVAPVIDDQVKIGLVQFSILVQHTPIGSTEIYQNKLIGCRFLGDSDDMGEGADADDIDLTLNPLQVVNIIDGKEVGLI